MVALALFTGPAVVASADPGGSGSTSGRSDSRARSGARTVDSTPARSASNEVDGAAAGSDQSERSSRIRRARPSLTTADSARTVRAPRTARTADDVSTGGTRVRPVAPAEPTVQAAPQLTTAAKTPLPAATPRPRVAPVVTAVDIAVAPPVTAPPPAVTTPPVAPLPVLDMSVTVLPLGPHPRPGQPMTSLFGVLGLMLIPLAGAALGYRQARAAARRDTRATAR